MDMATELDGGGSDVGEPGADDRRLIVMTVPLLWGSRTASTFFVPS